MNIVPSTDGIWDSFRISIGKQMIFYKFLFFGEYHVLTENYFPMRSMFCT